MKLNLNRGQQQQQIQQLPESKLQQPTVGSVQADESHVESFRVFVRVRPLNQKEQVPTERRKTMSIVSVQNDLVHIYDQEMQYDYTGKRDKSFCFDNVFANELTNAEVYDRTIQPLISNVLDGFNVTCFAYGMTGAGKTHTMLGSTTYHDYTNMGLSLQAVNGLYRGMIERQLESQYELRVSYLEIYNEQVKDLLVEKSTNLMIVDDPAKGVIVPDLQEFSVTRPEELQTLIVMGNQRRVMAPTGANQFSSRSHAILMFSIESRNRKRGIKEAISYSKLQLIDLAGSERASASDNKGQRMVEGANINRSLLALGNCINTLSDKGKAGSYIPYRDSKLTRLLKDSLGGNTKTIMIACISPSYLAYEETVNTLKYASRARNIKRVTTKNIKEVEIHVSKYKGIINNLKQEIDILRGQLKTQQNSSAMSVSPIRSPIEAPDQDIQQKKMFKKLALNRPQSTRQGAQNYSRGNTTPMSQNSQLLPYYQRQQTQRQQTFNKVLMSPQNANDSSLSINQSDHTQMGEIEEEIFKTQNERNKLHQELALQNFKGIQSPAKRQVDSDEEERQIDQMSQNLIANFEEHWELKQSIAELEELQHKNQDQLTQLSQDVQELEKQNQLKHKNQQLQQQIQKVIQFKNSELLIIEKNFSNNIQILNEMKQALEVNTHQKKKLQGMLLRMHGSKKKDLLETQIEMRKLKLEKTDLCLQNLEMKKLTQLHLSEKENNENKMEELQHVIAEMQRKLLEKDGIIKQTQQEIRKRDQEIYQFRGSQQSSNKQPSFSANKTVKLGNVLKSSMDDELVEISASLSARPQEFPKHEKLQDHNKKLVMSGFFDDDYQGEMVDQKPAKEEAPSTLNMLSQMISSKWQSHERKPSNKSRKGCTPNNRYKQEESAMLAGSGTKKQMLDVSNITVNMDNNQSDIIQIDDFLNCLDRDQDLAADLQHKPTPVATVNLFQLEQATAVQKTSKPQTKNQRYEEKAKQTNERGRNRQSDIKKSNKSAKLNRYLSFQKKAQDEPLKVAAADNDLNECEKENISRNHNQVNHYQSDLYKKETLDFFKSFDNEQKQNGGFIQLTKTRETEGQMRECAANRFEQRKYSQPINNKNEILVKSVQPQLRKSAQRPSPNSASRKHQQSPSSQSGVFQSYSQIRRASKERQLKQQSNSHRTSQQQSIQSNKMGLVGSFKADLNKDTFNNQRTKNSATSNINRCGPIKPSHCQTMTNSSQQNHQGPYNPGPLESQALSYFENFIKKKNSLANFSTQPNIISHSQNSGATKGNHAQSPLIHSKSSNHQSVHSGAGNDRQSATFDKRKSSMQKVSQISSFNTVNMDNMLSTQAIQAMVPPNSSRRVSKDVDSLISKQKAQLSKDIQKMQKNQSVFTNSFQSTIGGPNQQPLSQTERAYQSLTGGSSSRYSFRNNPRYSDVQNDDQFDEQALQSPDRVAQPAIRS